ncbi:uncharacterized protein LOC127788160 [Diospyros lotus]|uniref:uncharacterized protein LOC127788160 n=1 Tax=Diospyros lotus TaxID=55363 RepID=UPI00224F1FCC|nr:uncharacterized protein LOC127788160 [Diospyros lotus]
MASSSRFYENEGRSLSRAPFFDGTDYAYWKTMMEDFLTAYSLDLWEIVRDGPYVPKEKVKRGEVEEIVEKSRDKYTDEDKRLIALNAKAKSAFHCALSRSEFNYVQCCKSAYEILKKLELKYEDFEKVQKVLRSLPEAWDPKVTAIQEAKDTKKLSLDELMGSLMTHELTLKNRYKNKEDSLKSKSIALPVAQESNGEEDLEEEIAMLARRLRNFMKKNKRSFSKTKPVEASNEKKVEVTCYKCGVLEGQRYFKPMILGQRMFKAHDWKCHLIFVS